MACADCAAARMSLAEVALFLRISLLVLSRVFSISAALAITSGFGGGASTVISASTLGWPVPSKYRLRISC